MAMLTKSQKHKVEKVEVLNEFKDKVINYLRHEEAKLNGHKILYDLNDLEGILDSVFQAAVIDECEFDEVDEADLPF